MPSTIIPTLRYRDARAAVRVLSDVLGCEEQLVAEGPDGIVEHAQLRLGDGLLMLGSVREGEYGQLIKQPDEVGGIETQSAYVVVSDADAAYARAQAAGWKILMEIADQDYGGRLFTAADAEGHIWSIGSYDPWGD